ncbi:MAG TPA: alpha/beta fold hydrolase [Chthonomonadaceae bacterium]|nr:alpha/beta fold hydrolase [Chthonomonadaceae bacterium]
MSVPQNAPFTFEQLRSYPFPCELVTAPTGARAAWVFIQHGVYNLWAAEGPDWRAVRLTDYREDDGQELTQLQFTPDGEHLVYVRGGDHHANFPAPGDLQPNPGSSPVQQKVEILTIPFAGGTPKVIAEGDRPAISPQGDRIALLRSDQVWIAPTDASEPASSLFFVRGKCRDLQWAPDGQSLAFVSDRESHSLIGIYRSASEPIRYLAPSTATDTCPRWSPDGKQIAFFRILGNSQMRLPFEARPDLWSLWVADAETGEGRLLLRNPSTLPTLYSHIQRSQILYWAAGGRLVFRSDCYGWPHLYSLSTAGDAPLAPLTPGDYMVEDVAISPDKRFLVYSANRGDTPEDVDRRHLWRIALDAPQPQLLTSGTDLEYGPVITGDGAAIVFLSATPQRPALPAVLPMAGGDARLLAADQLPADFPLEHMAVPTPVTLHAADGAPVRCQRFEWQGNAGTEAGGKKPALLFVHGGPARQMLLGWHNMEYYANSYAVNQYFARCGYVVLSVNYRLGVGYGHTLTHPEAAGAAGASEYQDVLAAGEYLRSDPAVDPERIGIWGGSYGGYLAALALARNSELFAAGVDFCGVHDWTGSLKSLVVELQTRVEKRDLDGALQLAWNSSPVSVVATWKSPVLLIHGDDDRNVRFQQSIDLAIRLQEAGVEVEELVFPDDTHALRCYRNALRANQALIRFFGRRFGMPVGSVSEAEKA